MALVVEDGTGKFDADTYQDEAAVLAYLTAHGVAADWSAASAGEQEVACRNATRYLDTRYGRLWRGFRAKPMPPPNTSDQQALAWPRVSVQDDDGYALPSDALPTRLLEAHAEAALRDITETNGLLPDVAKAGDIKRKSVKIGEIAVDTEYQGSQVQLPTFQVVELLLAPLIEYGDRIVIG